MIYYTYYSLVITMSNELLDEIHIVRNHSEATERAIEIQ